MTAWPARRYRRWRHELVPLLAVFALPFALAAVFPFDAVFPSSRPGADASAAFGSGAGRAAEAVCAFVELTADEESAALAAARAAWLTDRGGLRRTGPEMFAEALPADPLRPVVGAADRTKVFPAAAAYIPAGPPTDFRAPPPAVFSAPAAPAAPPPAFPRADLLKLN